MNLDLIFDTNAVRELGHLPDDTWADCLAWFKNEDLKTAWIPWVLAELIGSNIGHDDFGDAHLKLVQRSASRFDDLAERKILPDLDDIFVEAVYRLADLTPPSPRTSGKVRNVRRALDFFLTLTNAEQVTTEADGNLVVRLTAPSGGRGWLNTLPRNFPKLAAANIAAMAERIGSAKAAERDEIKLAIDRYSRWVAHTAARLKIPTDVLESAWSKAGQHGFLNSPCSIGLYEAWYYALRVSRRKSRIKTNDGIDLHVAGYLTISSCIVTDDGDLRRLIAGVIDDQRRLVRFADFVRSIRPSPT